MEVKQGSWWEQGPGSLWEWSLTWIIKISFSPVMPDLVRHLNQMKDKTITLNNRHRLPFTSDLFLYWRSWELYVCTMLFLANIFFLLTKQCQWGIELLYTVGYTNVFVIGFINYKRQVKYSTCKIICDLEIFCYKLKSDFGTFTYSSGTTP